MLFNEPKLLKCFGTRGVATRTRNCFSALQRAEIAEILTLLPTLIELASFSALQRAEIAEICVPEFFHLARIGFSALQRAEIAEIQPRPVAADVVPAFQCSSTSRNC